MKNYILFIVFLSVICMAGNVLYAQESTDAGDTITIITSKDISGRHFTQRPKVGLVLSGGGAKGFSHLGVLRAINNAGVQVDYVGGTSIGAIVGGLYASGYTVEEMDSLLRDFDMMAMVGDKVERRHRSYYDKENEGKVWIKMGMKKFKLQFPTAISSGQNVINMMADWTISTHDIDDFSKLPIPYFSKVTDLSTGESVKLDKGYLPEAMRASATYPSLYSPIEIDGRTYIDGGVMDNYPIDEMRAMGADIVIGVNLNSPLYTAHEIESLVDILDQIVSFEIIRNVDKQMGNIDLDIHPDLRGYGAMSFTAADTIYARGEQAGALAMKHLEEIAAIQRRYQMEPRRITRPYVPRHFMVDTMIIHGNKLYDDDYFTGRVKGDFPMYMNLSDVKDVIDRIYSTGNFTNVYYRMRHSERDSTIYELHVTVKENPMDQYVGIGWVYDRLYGANILFNLRLNDVLKHTVIETDLVLGHNTSFKASIFHDNGRRLSFGADVKIGFLNAETSYMLTADPTIPNDYDMMMDCDIKTHYINSQFYTQKIIGQAFTTRLGVEY
ncbi:MAG: patatin-like phospholipase family protein, partial [Flavobacteriales bacterium]|nr:patatin-like phospholipase family protein [Flavobacteriales bacterium]